MRSIIAKPNTFGDCGNTEEGRIKSIKIYICIRRFQWTPRQKANINFNFAYFRFVCTSSAVGSKFVLGGLNYGLESGSNERARACVVSVVSEH